MIFDLDGVIWLGDKLVDPRVPALLKKLQSKGHRLYYLTNNSTNNQRGYQKKLSRLGIKARLEEIICSANAARMYLAKKVSSVQCPVSRLIGGSPKWRPVSSKRLRTKKPRIFVIGEKPLVREMEKLPVRVVSVKDGGRIDYVVIGADWHLTYKKLARAADAIIGGAGFIATNNDKTYPMQGRKLRPGCGAIGAALTAATNIKPCVVGKPNPYIIKGIPGMSGLNRGNTFVIGDRLDTDIVLANRMRVSSILVLSGTTDQEMARGAKGRQKPDYILKDVTQISKIVKRV